VPGADKVGQHLALGGLDHRAVGDTDDQVRTLGAGAVGALTGLPVATAPDRAAVEIQQRGHAGVDLENDVAAPAAVRAVGAAERLELLAPDGCAAMTAVPACHPKQRLIGKLRHDVPSSLS
jgi:hypothetical protein